MKVYIVIREEPYGEVWSVVGVYLHKKMAEIKKEIEEETSSFESDEWIISIEEHELIE